MSCRASFHFSFIINVENFKILIYMKDNSGRFFVPRTIKMITESPLNNTQLHTITVASVTSVKQEQEINFLLLF